MLIKTTILKVHPSEKESFKSSPAYFTKTGLQVGKERAEIRWHIKLECANGKTYDIRLSDGRKVNQFYEGKEIWGNETHGTFSNLESYWISKIDFENDVKKSINRKVEWIDAGNKEIIRLNSLLN